jgi:uncharacterized protein (TIGR02145 family)
MLLLAAVSAALISAPGVSYAQFGKSLLGAAANAAKGKAAEALTDGAMKELEKKFAGMVANEPLSDAAKANIVKKLSEMARPIVKKVVDAGMSGSLPNPADLVKTVLTEVMPRVPELVAAAKAESGGAVAVAPVQQPVPVQYAPPVQQSTPAPYAPQAQQTAPTQQASASLAAAAVAPVQPAKEKPKIAGCVYGAEDPSLNKAMTTRLIIALDNTGRYQAAENYKELFEQATDSQKSGTVYMNARHIKKLGEQFGVDYVCVAEITTVFGEKQVSAYILKVDASGIVAIGASDVPLKTLADLTSASEQIVEAMFKKAPLSADFGALNDARDGKTYKTVNIGGKVWMAENLNYQTASGSWCYYGNSDAGNCAKYGGRLYDWNTARSICPVGWHLSSRQEWDSMIATAGGSLVAGKKLKATSGWNGGGNGTNDFGFSATPGGFRANNGGFDSAGDGGNWWTAMEYGNPYGYARRISSYDDSADETYNYKEYGFSVRCVQD